MIKAGSEKYNWNRIRFVQSKLNGKTVPVVFFLFFFFRKPQCLNTIYFTSITQKAHITHTRILGGVEVGVLLSYMVEDMVDYPEETTELIQATTSLPHAETGDRTRAAAVPSEGFATALSRSWDATERSNWVIGAQVALWMIPTECWSNMMLEWVINGMKTHWEWCRWDGKSLAGLYMYALPLSCWGPLYDDILTLCKVNSLEREIWNRVITPVRSWKLCKSPKGAITWEDIPNQMNSCNLIIIIIIIIFIF